MILFGTKSVLRIVPNGRRMTRECGRCQGASELVEHSSRRYFTLYFVPLFPIASAERVLQCVRCKASYYLMPDDRSSAPSTVAQRTVSCPYCRQTLRGPDRSGSPLRLRCKACREQKEERVEKKT